MPAILTRKHEFPFILNFLFVQNLPSRDYVYIWFNGSMLNDKKRKYIVIQISIVFKWDIVKKVMIKITITLSRQDITEMEKN